MRFLLLAATVAEKRLLLSQCQNLRNRNLILAPLRGADCRLPSALGLPGIARPGAGKEVRMNRGDGGLYPIIRRRETGPDIGISPVAPIPVPIPRAKGHAGIVAGVVEMGRGGHLR